MKVSEAMEVISEELIKQSDPQNLNRIIKNQLILCNLSK